MNNILHEGEIEKSFSQDQVRYHSANLVMPNGDPWGQIFLSHPHTHDRFL